METWWKDSDFIHQIAGWAFDFEDRFNGRRIISIGQSPSWIVYGASKIRRLRQEAANITHVPFTGCFLARDKTQETDDDPVMKFNDKADWRWDTQELDHYFNYLGHLNAQPAQIGQQILDGQKVVITEMAKKCGGLASFLTAWLHSADENLRKLIAENVIFYIYDTEYKGNKDCIAVGKETTITLTRYAMPKHESEMIQNIAPMNLAEDNSSRLVPMYRMMAIGNHKPGLELCPNQDIRKQIRLTIYEEVQRQERLRQAMEAIPA